MKQGLFWLFAKKYDSKINDLAECCKNVTSKIIINSKYMIDFDKIDDLSFMIDDSVSKKLKKAKKNGKKSSRKYKLIKKSK